LRINRKRRIPGPRCVLARTAAAQLIAYWSGIVFLVEEFLPLVIGRPPAVATVIPASDPRIGSGSKCNATGHCALPSPRKGAVAFHAKFEHWSLDNEPFGPKKTHVRNADGVCRRALWREQDLALGVVDRADREGSAVFLREKQNAIAAPDVTEATGV
jgi:hypothetical protein